MKKILIIFSLGLLVYFQIFFNGFVWDDEQMFLKAGNNGESYFRPVMAAVYLWIHNIFGQNPFFFHFFQFAFHIATAVLIFYIFKHFFKEIISLFLAIIFLVHPSNVEAVSFISAMQETAFTFVGMAGLYLFIGGRDGALGTILLLVALLMKETAIVFFPLVFCYLLLFKKDDQEILISYSVFSTILLMGYFLFRFSGGNFYTQGQVGLFPIMRVSFVTRMTNIPMIIFYYLTKIFYPVNLAIAQHWVVKTINLQSFWLPLIMEIALFIGVITYFIKTKNKVFLFFFIWFIFGLLPHLQIIPLNMTVAERWLYFPMVGMLGMIGAIVESHKVVKSESLMFKIIVMIFISFFFTRSFIRTLDWRNGLSLFSRDIRQDSSFDLNNNMGVELYRVGKYDEAKKYFEKSTKLAPYWWVNWNNLGASYEREKNIRKAAEYYQKSIMNGQYYLAYQNFARIMVVYGDDRMKTEEFLKTALQIYPEDQKLLEINKYFKEK